MNLSLIIPAYNEENYISQTCNEFKNALTRVENLAFEIIIVNDSSFDSTQKKTELLALEDPRFKIINHSSNKGKGASIQSALKEANGELIVLGDADMELDPNDIIKLIGPILKGEVDFVNGSRYMGKHNKTNIRTIINKIYTLFFSFLVFKKVGDFACGYKAFKRSALKNIQLQENRFCIEAELMMKVCKNRVSFKEVAVSYVPRTSKQGKKLNNADALRILFSIIKYRFIN